MQFSRVLFRAISTYLQLWRPALSICNTFKIAFSTFCGFSQIAVERALAVGNMLHSVLITATSIFPTLCHYQLTCSDCHVVSLPVIMIVITVTRRQLTIATSITQWSLDCILVY